MKLWNICKNREKWRLQARHTILKSDAQTGRRIKKVKKKIRAKFHKSCEDQRSWSHFLDKDGQIRSFCCGDWNSARCSNILAEGWTCCVRQHCRPVPNQAHAPNSWCTRSHSRSPPVCSLCGSWAVWGRFVAIAATISLLDPTKSSWLLLDVGGDVDGVCAGEWVVSWMSGWMASWMGEWLVGWLKFDKKQEKRRANGMPSGRLENLWRGRKEREREDAWDEIAHKRLFTNRDKCGKKMWWFVVVALGRRRLIANQWYRKEKEMQRTPTHTARQKRRATEQRQNDGKFDRTKSKVTRLTKGCVRIWQLVCVSIWRRADQNSQGWT